MDNNIGFWPQYYAATQPNQVAFKIPIFKWLNSTVTYQQYTFHELENKIQSAHDYFLQHNVQPGYLVLLIMPMSPKFIANLFGLFRIGAIPILIDPGLPIKKMASALNPTQPTLLIGKKIHLWIAKYRLKLTSIRRHISPPPTKKIYQNLNNHYPTKTENKPHKKSFDAKSTLAIVFTSGSTGIPKGVTYTHELCKAQLNLLKTAYQLDPGKIDIPLLLNFCLFNPALGIATVLPPINVKAPLKTSLQKLLKILGDKEITHSFGSPIFWKAITTKALKLKKTFSHIQKLFLAGCSAPTGLIENLKIIFPNAHFEIPYGATEALPLTTLSGTLLCEKQKKHPYAGACLGKPLPGIKIIILDLSQPCPLSPMTVGEIAASGPIVSQDYDQLPNQNKENKWIDHQQTLWHRMGDVGYIDHEGCIWFLGRKKECCITASQIMYTEPCEAVFLKHPAVQRAALIFIPTKTASIPAMVIEPKQWSTVYLPWKKKAFIRTLQTMALSKAHTSTIQHFFIQRSLPVDIRHNAKIHRLSLQKKYTPHVLKSHLKKYFSKKI
jgi:acyl-CoA synthetase (AMP-forming)/AMP-acid ligase II